MRCMQNKSRGLDDISLQSGEYSLIPLLCLAFDVSGNEYRHTSPPSVDDSISDVRPLLTCPRPIFRLVKEFRGSSSRMQIDDPTNRNMTLSLKLPTFSTNPRSNRR